MDAKTGYSTLVSGSKNLARTNSILNKNISSGQMRNTLYSSNWESVNINTIVEHFAPNSSPHVISGKVIYVSKNARYEIIADIGGGYLRIYDHNLKCYVDKHGNDVRNYIDKNGKSHGRNKAEQQALTHFRILKREEMK